MSNQTNTPQPSTTLPSPLTDSLTHSFTDSHNQFAQPAVLETIGPARVAKFLDGFSDDLKGANIILPTPDSANGEYFGSVAALLASPELLPNRLRLTLITLEAAASSENAERLDTAIQQRIPCVSINRNCPLDCVLELWFAAPDELSQFQPQSSSSSSSSSSIPPTPLPPAGALTESLTHSLTTSPSALLPLTDSLTHPLTPLRPSSPTSHLSTLQLSTSSVAPWPESVNGVLLLDILAQTLRRFVVLPLWAAETLALWIVHTFAFQLRDVCTYIGVESPEKQCGKTTLLTVLSELANRAVTASNISPPAFFRVIEDLCPTLLIDEADTFLRGNEQLKGILNAGYKKKTAFVLRASYQAEEADTPSLQPSTPHTASPLTIPLTHSPAHSPAPSSLAAPELGQGGYPPTPDTRHSSLSQVTRFSCWCPKLISQIGRLPDTLADRCIVIRMQRKTRHEECERLRNLDADPLKQQCARFVLDHQQQIAAAKPEFPAGLSDRASDIWEPLLAIADLAGGDWPQKARQAAVSLSAAAQENNPIGSLLLDIFVVFLSQNADRLFSRTLVEGLNRFTERPWAELRKCKPITELWLSHQLRPYGVRPKTFRINGTQAKGYLQEDLMDVFQRYITKSDLEALVASAIAGQPAANATSEQPGG